MKELRTTRRVRRQVTNDAPRVRLGMRDQMLVALTEKAMMNRVLEASHSASEWGSAAVSGSKVELNQGLELIAAEQRRLEDRIRAAAARGGKVPDGVKRSAVAAERERVECRLAELVEGRKHLLSLHDRLRAELEIESIEWQRPLTVGESEIEVVGYVDLWASVRTSTYRIQQGVDPWDPEGRSRYEGCTLHHLIRNVAIQVEPRIHSLTALVRRVKFVQAHAKNALPLVVTGTAPGTDVLAGQGIPVYVWSPEASARAGSTGGALPERRTSRVPALGAAPVDGTSRPSLPSPRPSLPPAPLT